MKLFFCPVDFSRARKYIIRSKRWSHHKFFYLSIIFLFYSGSEGNTNPPHFQWPLKKKLNSLGLKGITSTFAESRFDHFHNGVDISAYRAPVFPIASGFILFVREESHDPFQPVSGPGNLILIEHENGWRSGYFHLKKPARSLSGSVQKNSIIGHTGNSGRSLGAHLHFFISNKNGNSYINPMEKLPPVLDNHPPVIGQLVIFTPRGITRISHSRPQQIRLTRYYPVYVNIADPGFKKHTRRGIYSMRWQLNDQEEQKRIFDTLSYSADGWKTGENKYFKDIYKNGLYNIGELEFKSGTNILKLWAADFTGNSVSQEYEINVTTSVSNLLRK